jgi:3,4-dihydroxy 2-butanone 4-phosphate synthase/GTP cyclohydrolase II
MPLVKDCYLIRDHRFIVQLNRDRFARFRKERPERSARAPVHHTVLVPRPRVLRHRDRPRNSCVLTYDKPKIYDLPIIRLQSESLLQPPAAREHGQPGQVQAQRPRDRPLRRRRDLPAVLRRHGAGFGAHATDRMLTERGGRLLAATRRISKLGVGYDSRDYDACFQLLRHHVPNARVQMIMNSPLQPREEDRVRRPP